jgi:hypothetical protein
MPRLDAMKLHFHTICLILLVLSSCSAPKPVTGIEERRQQHLDVFLDLLRNNDAAGLAKLVHYPLSRGNPIPNVENEADFIRRYDTLLDSEFRKTLVQTTWDSTNTMESNDRFMLGSGEIWLDYEGKIIAINHQSPAESQMQKASQTKMLIAIHPDVEPWQHNLKVCETDKFLIRLDEMAGGDLRYVSWSKPKTFKDKPDLILLGGESQQQGTMGGFTYTFKNEGWTYVIDEVQMAESDEDIGLFLRIRQGEGDEISARCTEIK